MKSTNTHAGVRACLCLFLCVCVRICIICEVCSVPFCATVCTLSMGVLSDVVSNVKACRRWSVERACSIIAATVTGRAVSVRVSYVGNMKEECLIVCVCCSVSASLSLPPISFSPVGSFQMVANFQMFSSSITHIQG